jgi:hypothetical protein
VADEESPWDDVGDEENWYVVEDDVRWDPDDDGVPQRIPAEVLADDPYAADLASRRAGDFPLGEAPAPASGSAAASAPPTETSTAAARRGRPGLFGLAAGAMAGGTRFLSEAIFGAAARTHPDVAKAVDTAVGVGGAVTSVTGAVVGTAGRLARPFADVMLHPPLVPERLSPGGILHRFEVSGRTARRWGEQDVIELIGKLLPAVVDAVLDRLDLTQIVLDRVDLDRVVRAVDLDAAVAGVDLAEVIDRIDIDAILAKVDLNAVLAGVDLDAVVSRLDLNKIIERVDIEAVLARLDLDDIVSTVDLDKIIRRVDVNALASTIDMEAIINRIDLAGIAEDIITEVDLPQIIRVSSGSIASETVVGVRMTSATADDYLVRIMQRLHLRRRGDPDDDPTALNVPIAPLPPRRRLLGSADQAPSGTDQAPPGTDAAASGSARAPLAPSRSATDGDAPEGQGAVQTTEPVVDIAVPVPPRNGSPS